MSGHQQPGDPTHRDILEALGDLREEVRVGNARIDGKLEVVQAQVVDLRDTNSKQWSRLETHSQQIGTLLMRRTRADQQHPNHSGQQGGGLAVDVRSTKVQALIAGTLLVLVLIVAGLAGVDLPGWLSSASADTPRLPS